MLVVDWETEGDDGRFYGFETITFCPIDTRAIEKSMLTEEEADWLNGYHERVYSLLAPQLNEEEAAFLKQETARI
jgi:Xaa-Pro aminopeptidase